MGYCIQVDWSEEWKHESKWENHGRNILEESCKHKDQDDDEDGESNIRYSGYCEDCGVSEDTAQPMMNYAYPLDGTSYSEEKILEVVKETNLTVLENTETGEWFLALCGGGMDLSQDIALAYIIMDIWIPADLINEVNKQACLSLGETNYKRLANEVIRQLEIHPDSYKRRAKEWQDSLKNMKSEKKCQTKKKSA